MRSVKRCAGVSAGARSGAAWHRRRCFNEPPGNSGRGPRNPLSPSSSGSVSFSGLKEVRDVHARNASNSGTIPVSRLRRRRERWTRLRARRGHAAYRGQIPGTEALEERTLLSGLSAMRLEVTLDDSVEPPYSQDATWSARDGVAHTALSIPQEAAGDATDEFRWTGWHSSDSQGLAAYSATFEYIFSRLAGIGRPAGRHHRVLDR